MINAMYPLMISLLDSYVCSLYCCAYSYIFNLRYRPTRRPFMDIYGRIRGWPPSKLPKSSLFTKHSDVHIIFISPRPCPGLVDMHSQKLGYVKGNLHLCSGQFMQNQDFLTLLYLKDFKGAFLKQIVYIMGIYIYIYNICIYI